MTRNTSHFASLKVIGLHILFKNCGLRFLILNTLVFALAAEAENYQALILNDKYYIAWSHPAGGCDQGDTCFNLRRNQSSAGDLNLSLNKFGIPLKKNQRYIIGETQSDIWLIFDTEKESILFEGKSADEAKQKFSELGEDVKKYFAPNDQNKYFSQTWSSLLGNTFLFFIRNLPYLILIILTVFIALLAKSFKRKSGNTRKKGDLHPPF